MSVILIYISLFNMWKLNIACFWANCIFFEIVPFCAYFSLEMLVFLSLIESSLYTRDVIPFFVIDIESIFSQFFFISFDFTYDVIFYVSKLIIIYSDISGFFTELKKNKTFSHTEFKRSVIFSYSMHSFIFFYF